MRHNHQQGNKWASKAYMGQIPQEGENGQNVFYFLFFWSSTEENFVRYILRMFFLVLAHLELKLGLFEVDDIGDLGDDDL